MIYKEEASGDKLLKHFLRKHLLFFFPLCRPGRLEVQVEINLPDENGRLQILQIHTNQMKENSFLAPDVNLQELGTCIEYVYVLDICIHSLVYEI